MSTTTSLCTESVLKIFVFRERNQAVFVPWRCFFFALKVNRHVTSACLGTVSRRCVASGERRAAFARLHGAPDGGPSSRRPQRRTNSDARASWSWKTPLAVCMRFPMCCFMFVRMHAWFHDGYSCVRLLAGFVRVLSLAPGVGCSMLVWCFVRRTIF